MFYLRTGPHLRARVPISPAGVPAQTSLLCAAGTVPLSIPQCGASGPSSREVFKELHLFCHGDASQIMEINIV